MTEAMLKERDLVRITGLSRTTLWRLERRGLFPRRRELSPGRVAWLASEVEAWAAGRPERVPGATK